MSDTYILDGKKPIKCNHLEWAIWYEKADRHVAKDIIGEIVISTVFLGIDHNWGDGPPFYLKQWYSAANSMRNKNDIPHGKRLN